MVAAEAEAVGAQGEGDGRGVFESGGDLLEDPLDPTERDTEVDGERERVRLGEVDAEGDLCGVPVWMDEALLRPLLGDPVGVLSGVRVLV